MRYRILLMIAVVLCSITLSVSTGQSSFAASQLTSRDDDSTGIGTAVAAERFIWKPADRANRCKMKRTYGFAIIERKGTGYLTSPRETLRLRIKHRVTGEVRVRSVSLAFGDGSLYFETIVARKWKVVRAATFATWSGMTPRKLRPTVWCAGS